jgi:hypothetical protein
MEEKLLQNSGFGNGQDVTQDIHKPSQNVTMYKEN